ETREKPRADGRMQDRLEPTAPRRIDEDDGRQLLAIQRAIGREHVTEFPDDRGQGRLTRRDNVARELVGVDHDAAEAAQHLRDRALAGGDAAGEAGEEKAPRRRGHTCDQSSPDFTSTTTGTSSGSAASMTSRASVSTAGTSCGGASKSSSSCTC